MYVLSLEDMARLSLSNSSVSFKQHSLSLHSLLAGNYKCGTYVQHAHMHPTKCSMSEQGRAVMSSVSLLK